MFKTKPFLFKLLLALAIPFASLVLVYLLQYGVMYAQHTLQHVEMGLIILVVWGILASVILNAVVTTWLLGINWGIIWIGLSIPIILFALL